MAPPTDMFTAISTSHTDLHISSKAKRLRLARVVRERWEGDFTFTSLTRIAHEEQSVLTVHLRRPVRQLPTSLRCDPAALPSFLRIGLLVLVVDS